MHELAVTEYVYNIVKKQAELNNVNKVEKINLLIGDQCDYVPEIIEELARRRRYYSSLMRMLFRSAAFLRR